MTKEEIFNTIKADILKGPLQERLGYDLYGRILNNTYAQLPEASKAKFDAFIRKEFPDHE